MNPSKGRIIELPKIIDPRGNLTVADGIRNVPFDIKRVYWTYDIPAGESRGGHAHKLCKELIIAVSGSFDVTLDDGEERVTFHLNHLIRGFMWIPVSGARLMIFLRVPFVLSLRPSCLRKKTIFATTTSLSQVVTDDDERLD